jgi:hypothetical protein
MLNSSHQTGSYDEMSTSQLDSLIIAWGSMTRWFEYSLAFVVVGGVGLLTLSMILGPDWAASGCALLPELLIVGSIVCLFVAIGKAFYFWWLRVKYSGVSIVSIQKGAIAGYWRRPYLPRVILIIVTIAGVIGAVYFRHADPPIYLLILGAFFILARRIRSYF